MTDMGFNSKADLFLTKQVKSLNFQRLQNIHNEEIDRVFSFLTRFQIFTYLRNRPQTLAGTKKYPELCSRNRL